MPISENDSALRGPTDFINWTDVFKLSSIQKD